MMNKDYSINICGLNFGYTYPILQNISIDIPYRSKIFISGANGSGKTTFMKLISGELENQHSILINQHDNNVSRYTAYAPQSNEFLIQNGSYSVASWLKEYCVAQYNFKNNDLKIQQLCNEFSLLPQAQIKYLSYGQMKILSFLGLILSNKPILIFDETFEGFSLNNFDTALKYLNDLNSTIIVTSHRHKEHEHFDSYTHMMLQNKSLIQVDKGKKEAE